MKKLSLKAAQVFNTLIEKMEGKDYLKLDNSDGAFMPLSIERLSQKLSFGSIDVDIYSLSHYFKQNGDLIPDPDMTFAVSKTDGYSIWPFSYQDQFAFQESIFQDHSGVWKINVKAQHDQVVFAGMWLQNIKNQQNL